MLYYPQTDKFVVSNSYKSYATDSYFTVDMNGYNVTSVTSNKTSRNTKIHAEHTYEYHTELSSLCVRMLMTIAIELGIALLFGIRKSKQLLLLVGVNIGTQIMLNILLNIIYAAEPSTVLESVLNLSNISAAAWKFLCHYLILELGVFVIESFA